MTDCKADSLTLHFNSIASQGIHITRPYFIKAKPVKKDVVGFEPVGELGTNHIINNFIAP